MTPIALSALAFAARKARRWIVAAVCALVFVAALATGARADDGDEAFSGDGSGDLAPESFEASFGSAPGSPGGMIGGSGMGYRSRLTFAPHYERQGSHAYLWLGPKEVTGVDLYRHDPGASLAQLDWQGAVPQVDTPPGGVVAVRFVFDTGTVVAAPGGGGYTAPAANEAPTHSADVPPDANRLMRVEVDWKWTSGWGDAEIAKRTLVFPAADDSEGAEDAGSTGIAGLTTGALLVTLGAIGVIGARRWSPSRKKSTPAKVRIVAPSDLTIQLCGKDLTFTAETEPPGREADVLWEVPSAGDATPPHGKGASFVTRFGETGVKQVIARLDGEADDVLLALFDTGGADSALGDLVASALPGAGRGPRSYTWYRQHDVPPDEGGLDVTGPEDELEA